MKNYDKISGVCFERLNKNTKQASAYMKAYYNANAEDIWQAYGRPSYRKISIFEEWRSFMNGAGFNCYIASYNTSIFTLVGMNEAGDVMYITPAHNYIVRA